MAEISFEQQLSFLSAALFLILGSLTLINKYRDRVTIAFAVLCFALAATGAVSMWVEGAATLEQFAVRIKFNYAAFGVIPLFILNHVLAITDYHRHRNERLLGLSLRGWCWTLTISNLILVALLEIPGVVVLGYESGPVSGFEPVFRPVLPWMMSLVVGGIVLLAVYMTTQALRRSSSQAYRHFLWLNVAGALAILVAAPLFGVLFPIFGLPGEILVQVSMVVSSLIFFHAINRYQLDQFHQLNQELEAKVEQRTRHLEEAQERLLRSEKLAAAGRLAAGVTHEVNNPMGAILSATDTISRSLKKLQRRSADQDLSPDELRRNLDRTMGILERSDEVLQSAWARVQSLMTSLHGFVGLDAATFQQVDLNRSLDDTLTLIRQELGQALQVDKRYRELPPVLVSRADLSELLGHLLRNADQAMEGAGVITLTTSVVGAEVELNIADSGPGIPEEKLPGLFEPRFTSDGARVKLGIGLATSYRIAEQHGGSLSARNGEEGGAVLTLRLPVGDTPENPET